MTKLRVGVIFGGKSAEHEVSLQSAKNIVDAIDKEKFDVTLLGIDKQGQWHINDASNYLLNAENPALIALNRSNKNVALIGRGKTAADRSGQRRRAGPTGRYFPDRARHAGGGRLAAGAAAHGQYAVRRRRRARLGGQHG